MSTDPSFDIPNVGDALVEVGRQDRMTVLHVDDDSSFVDLVSVCLERAETSLDVISETSATDALDRIQREPVDCIVSDYDMPGMNGLDLLEAVREDFPDLPFVLFTGKGSEEIASEAISTGVTDYLQKEGGTDQYTVLANRITNAVERYRAEREVEYGFSAMETAREGISLLDEEGTFIYVNSAYAETYGYDRADLIDEHWETLYPEEHVDRVYEDILPSVPDEGRWMGETVHERADGERIVVDHALAYTDADALICLIQDITEQKATEQTLEVERQRFELFVDAVSEYAIFMLDPDGRVTSWNRGAERIKGYTEPEILGEHVSTFYPEERVAAGYPDDLLAQAIEEGSVEDEGPRLRKDGSQFWADVTITAVFDQDGQHRGFVKVTEDLSERYGAGIDLGADEGIFQQAVDMLEDIFYVLDTDGEFIRVSDGAAAATGYRKAELLEMSALDFFPDEERPRVQTKIETAMAEGRARLEANIVTQTGTRVPYEFRTRRLTDEDGTIVGVAGIGRDISDRQRRERRLEQQLSQFEHFGNILGHDLRTPLQVATSRLELARETGEAEHFEETAAALDRLDGLIENLASVMREGELVGDVTDTPLPETARSVWSTLRTGDATLDAPEECSIRADEEALARLLENLLSNAVEHGGETVTVGRLPDGFYVADDGPGVPDEDADRLFDPGYSTAESGSGFGLASVRQIAVAHGWDVSVTDSDAGGARFDIRNVKSAAD